MLHETDGTGLNYCVYTDQIVFTSKWVTTLITQNFNTVTYRTITARKLKVIHRISVSVSRTMVTAI